MSIVNEALKKASRDKTSPPVSKDLIREALSLKIEKPKAQIWGPLFVFAVILTLSAPFWISYVNGPLRFKNINSAPESLGSYAALNVQAASDSYEPISTKRGRFATPEVIAMESASLPESLSNPEPIFALQGIAYDKNASVALINNKMVSTGQTVDGASVETIGSDRVLIAYAGKKITLRLR